MTQGLPRTSQGTVIARVWHSAEWEAVESGPLSGEAKLAWLRLWCSIGGAEGKVCICAADLARGRDARSGRRSVEALVVAGLLADLHSHVDARERRRRRPDGRWTGYLVNPLEIARGCAAVSPDPQIELPFVDEVDAGARGQSNPGDARGACSDGKALVVRFEDRSSADTGTPAPADDADPDSPGGGCGGGYGATTAAKTAAPNLRTLGLRDFSNLSSPSNLRAKVQQPEDQARGGCGAETAGLTPLGDVLAGDFLAGVRERYEQKKDCVERKIRARVRCPKLMPGPVRKWAQAIAGGLIDEAELDSILHNLDQARSRLLGPPSAYFMRASKSCWSKLSIAWGYQEEFDPRRQRR